MLEGRIQFSLLAGRIQGPRDEVEWSGRIVVAARQRVLLPIDAAFQLEARRGQDDIDFPVIASGSFSASAPSALLVAFLLGLATTSGVFSSRVSETRAEKDCPTGTSSGASIVGNRVTVAG